MLEWSLPLERLGLGLKGLCNQARVVTGLQLEGIGLENKVDGEPQEIFMLPFPRKMGI